MISKGGFNIRGKGLSVFWPSYFSLVTIQLPSVTALSNDFEFSPGPVDLGLGMSWIALVGEIFLERRVLWVHWFREASQVAWTIRDFRGTADFFSHAGVCQKIPWRWKWWLQGGDTPVMRFALQSPVFLDTCHKYLVGGFIFLLSISYMGCHPSRWL